MYLEDAYRKMQSHTVVGSLCTEPVVGSVCTEPVVGVVCTEPVVGVVCTEPVVLHIYVSCVYTSQQLV